jgi:hypothetical protein
VISYCDKPLVVVFHRAKIFHCALLPHCGLLRMILLVTQIFCHCLFDSLCEVHHSYLQCREGVTVHYRARETNIYWHHDKMHKKKGEKWKGHEVLASRPIINKRRSKNQGIF